MGQQAAYNQGMGYMQPQVIYLQLFGITGSMHIHMVDRCQSILLNIPSCLGSIQDNIVV
jgi:hypothetical protein